MLMMLCHLLHRCLVDEIVQVQLLLVRGLTSLIYSVILEAVLAEFWEVLEVVWLISVGYCLRLFLVFECVEALSIEVFFLLDISVHMIDGGKFHLGVLSVFISCFGTSLVFAITSINGSLISAHSSLLSILINRLTKLSFFNCLILICR
jgi:hypothetical protein